MPSNSREIIKPRGLEQEREAFISLIILEDKGIFHGLYLKRVFPETKLLQRVFRGSCLWLRSFDQVPKTQLIFSECGQPGRLSGLVPPSAQGVILETQDRVPCQVSCMELASPSACVSVSLSLCLFYE